MALTKCPECGKDISTYAASCPYCGFPVGSIARESVPQVVPPLPPNHPTPPAPRPATGSKADNDKIKKGCLGCAGVLAIVALIGLMTGLFDTDDHVPNKTQITQDFPCFRKLSDLEDFKRQYDQGCESIWKSINSQMLQTVDRNVSDKEVSAISEAAGTKMANEMSRQFQSLQTKFAAEGRLWDVPLGTEIKVSKCYDSKGNEITPVWKEPLKAFFAPDGNEVYVEAEWNGKIVYTMLQSSTAPN